MNDQHTTAAFVAGNQVTALHSRSRKAISPASPEQRRKCLDAVCVNCGFPGCDPAHLTARTQGGCSHEDCVIPLCRNCHRAFDNGAIDLEPILALREYRAEAAHMATHNSLRACLRRLNGRSTNV